MPEDPAEVVICRQTMVIDQTEFEKNTTTTTTYSLIQGEILLFVTICLDSTSQITTLTCGDCKIQV